jgi:hypothetical protein
MINMSGFKASSDGLRMRLTCTNFQVLNKVGQNLKKKKHFSVLVLIGIVQLIQIAAKIKNPQYLTKSITSRHVTLKWDRT